MPLRFLVPAFLAGLLALAIPLLVHLTRKRKAEVRSFPSLMFLERVPYRAESRRRIQHWLLLLLRAAAVVLIVAAFARPFFDDDASAAGAAAGPREVVILVDRSYSMAVADRWERARDAARAAVEGLGPLDRASVVFFDAGAEVAVRSSADRARLLGALDGAAPSDRATRYGPGLKLARAIFDESGLPAGELVMIGDFQRAGWTGEEGVGLPAGVEVRTVALSDGTPPDRAVADVALARERFQERERVTPTARLTRTGGEADEEVEVVLEIDGREAERRTVTLPPSGSATVTFGAFTLSESHTRGTVRMEPDALPGDDARHFVVSPGEALPVIVLDDGSDAGASSLYLSRALRVAAGTGFDVTVRRGGAVGPAELEGRSVVVVNDRPIPPSSARALRDFVEAGGGLVVVLGERASWPDGVEGVLPGEPGAATDRGTAPGGRGSRLGQMDYDHPVFEVFRGPRTGDFTGARFFRARDFRVADTPEVRVLARYDDGAPALVERTVGAEDGGRQGRVLVWTSTLDAFWNDLALQPVFLPFVHQLVRHASGRAEALPSFEAGQVIDVTDARAMETAGLGPVAGAGGGERAEEDELIVLSPSGVAGPLHDSGRFLELEERGFYRVRPAGAGDDVRPLAVAVNVDLAEADLTPLDPEEVAATLTVGSNAAEGVDLSRVGAGAGAEGLRLEDRERRQSLWRFLLVGAFALLALESLLSNRRDGRTRTTRGA